MVSMAGHWSGESTAAGMRSAIFGKFRVFYHVCELCFSESPPAKISAADFRKIESFLSHLRKVFFRNVSVCKARVVLWDRPYVRTGLLRRLTNLTKPAGDAGHGFL